MTTLLLDCLPQELVHMVCRQLATRDKCHLAATNRLFCAIVTPTIYRNLLIVGDAFDYRSGLAHLPGDWTLVRVPVLLVVYSQRAPNTQLLCLLLTLQRNPLLLKHIRRLEIYNDIHKNGLLHVCKMLAAFGDQLHILPFRVLDTPQHIYRQQLLDLLAQAGIGGFVYRWGQDSLAHADRLWLDATVPEHLTALLSTPPPRASGWESIEMYSVPKLGLALLAHLTDPCATPSPHRVVLSHIHTPERESFSPSTVFGNVQQERHAHMLQLRARTFQLDYEVWLRHLDLSHLTVMDLLLGCTSGGRCQCMVDFLHRLSHDSHVTRLQRLALRVHTLDGPCEHPVSEHVWRLVFRNRATLEFLHLDYTYSEQTHSQITRCFSANSHVVAPNSTLVGSLVVDQLTEYATAFPQLRTLVVADFIELHVLPGFANQPLHHVFGHGPHHTRASWQHLYDHFSKVRPQSATVQPSVADVIHHFAVATLKRLQYDCRHDTMFSTLARVDAEAYPCPLLRCSVMVYHYDPSYAIQVEQPMPTHYNPDVPNTPYAHLADICTFRMTAAARQLMLLKRLHTCVFNGVRVEGGEVVLEFM